MRKAPLAAPAVAIIAGILLAHHVPSITIATWLWLMAACSVVMGICIYVRPRMAAVGAVLLCGMVGGILTTHSEQRHWSRHCADHAFLTVHLDETPQPRTKSYRAKGHVPGQGDITVYLRADSTAAALRYGDRLLLHGYPDRERQSIYITSDHYIVVERDSSSLRARSEALRMRLVRRMQSGPLRHAGVAEALTLGWRADIDPATQDLYRSAGIAHLLAVSGLHVGLIAAIVGALLFWTGNERRGRTVRGVAQMLAVWLFTLVTGLAPSAIRAALMFSLFIVANISERRTPKFNLLAATAIATLVAKPLLLFDVGWQMSYSAIAGILLCRPLIAAFRNKVWQASMVSIAATAATLPVSLATFHRFYPYFLIANILIVPLAGIMLFLSLVYMALPCAATAWPLDLVLQCTDWLTALVASLPGAVLKL